MKRTIVLLSFLSLNFITNNYAQESKLKKGKESLQKSTTVNTASTTTKNKKSSRRTRRNDLNDNSFLAQFIYPIFAYTAYGLAIESPFERNGRMHDAEIAHYPYELASHGNFIYTDSTNYNITRFDIYNRFLIENKHLYGNNLGVDFRFFKRFSLSADYLSLTEKKGSLKERFNMFSALLKYNRIRTQYFDAWFGLGLVHVGNEVDETRFLIGLGGELFIKKPISLLVSHKWAKVNSESVNNTKLLLKYHIKNYRISSGYEHYKIGISKIDMFSLGIEASF